MLRAALVILALSISTIVNAQTLGTNTQIPTGTCIAGVANAVVLCANSADNTLSINPNNTGLANLPVTAYSTGSYTNATTGFTSVTGLSFAVSASRNYHAYCRVTWQGSAGTTGPKYQFTGPATPTAVILSVFSWVTSSTFQAQSIITAFATPYANTGTVTTATNFTDTVDLVLLNSTNAGTVQLQMAANGAGTLTVANGSFCLVQ